MRVETHRAHEEQSPVDMALAAALKALADSLPEEEKGKKQDIHFRNIGNKPGEREWKKIELWIKEDGVRAVITYVDVAEDYARFGKEWTPFATLYLLSDGERFTFPYRHIELLFLPDILRNKSIGTYRMKNFVSVVKPRRFVGIDEAITLKGMENFRYFFTNERETSDNESKDPESFSNQRKELERIRQGNGNFFQWDDVEVWDEDCEPITDEAGNVVTKKHLGAIFISPALLAEEMGETYGSFEEYVSGISRLLKRDLNAEEVKALEFPYYHSQAEAFLSYCLYTFLYSEKYSDLQEAVAQYRRFGLPDDWEEQENVKYTTNGDSPTDWVLTQYYCIDNLGAEHSIKEVAAYTGAPYKTLLRLSERDRLSRLNDNNR